MAGNSQIRTLYHRTLGINFDAKKTEQLLELCTGGCKAELGQFEELLKSGANPNSCNQNGWSPLALASRAGKNKVVELFLCYKAYVNTKTTDELDRTPLHIACIGGHVDVVRTLIQGGAIIDQIDMKNQTALHIACEQGHVELARTLVEHGASYDQTDMKNRTALHIACEQGHVVLARTLIQSAESYDQIVRDKSTTLRKTDHLKAIAQCGASIDQRDKYGRTAVRLACENGLFDLFKFFQQHGASVDKEDMTKLLLKLCEGENTAELGQIEEVLKNGADSNGRSQLGWSCLTIASAAGKKEVVKLLLRYKANVDLSATYGETALFKACKGGHVEVVKILLKSGASLVLKDWDQRTALHVACAGGHIEVVRTLIQAGVSIFQIDRYGQTPLHMASDGGHVEVVRALMLCGHLITHMKDKDLCTALHMASTRGHVEVARILLQFGASTDQKDKWGRSPLDLAIQRSHSELVRLFEEGNVLGTPKEYILPELSSQKGYKCVASSTLGLVYLSSSHYLSACIEPITDSKLHPSLKSNEILLTPIVSVYSQDIALDLSQPAIIELVKSVVPTDLNQNRQLVPIYSHANCLQWEELDPHDCEMLDDRVRFKTTRFGYFSVMVRFPFPSASTTIDPNMQQQAELEIQELPGFKLEVPPASVPTATKITATILYENPQVTKSFKERSLASACVKLEPAKIQFKDEVKIALPIPNYRRITDEYPNVKLEVWLSKSTDAGVPVSWEPAYYDTNFDENGECLVTARITHFSNIAAFWNRPVDYIMNFFTTQVRGRIQVFMSAEQRWESFLKFGVAVLLYPFKEPYQEVPNYPYPLFDSVLPIDVAVGNVECQIELDDMILRKFSVSPEQKSYKKNGNMSRDCNMRADFNIELHGESVKSELPEGTVATLLVKHGSENSNPHEFNLIKRATKQPLESSVDQAKPCLTIIEKAAHGLKKTTEELKQNVLTLSARKIAEHMQKVTHMACDTSGFAEGDQTVTYIMQLIVDESEEIEKISEQIAQACIEPTLKKNLLAETARIPSLSRPLKLTLRTINKKRYCEGAAAEAIDLLTTNAENLRTTVEAVLFAADRAIIKVPSSMLETLAPKGLLNIDDLHRVLVATWEVRAKWYNCGLALGFTAGTLDAVRKTNRGDCDDCYTETLKEWLKRARPLPTWSALSVALGDPSVGHRELAENLVSYAPDNF